MVIQGDYIIMLILIFAYFKGSSIDFIKFGVLIGLLYGIGYYGSLWLCKKTSTSYVCQYLFLPDFSWRKVIYIQQKY